MSRIGQLITRAVSDGKVTKAEVDGLIQQAQANGTVSSSEKRELKSFLTKQADKFEADAQTTLASFLGETVTAPATPSTPPQPADPKPSDTVEVPLSEDPALLDKHVGMLSYNKVEGGQLYADGVSYDDVVQGSIGDCYFVGSISAVAYADPKLIENAIKDNGDGTFTVRFYERGRDGKTKEKLVRVDNDFPTYGPGSSPRYAKARDSKELWVSVLEKAWASLKGGYEQIGNGGCSTDVMTALTGQPSCYYTTKGTKPDELFELIKLGAEMKTPMTAGTWGEKDNVDYSGTGVYAWHNYSMLGAVEENGVKYVQLRNPWGSSEPGSDGKNDGIFKMKLDDFVRLYQGINVN